MLTKYFPPEIGSASHLFFELAESLVSKGHKVTVVTHLPWYNLCSIENKYKKRLFMSEKLKGIKVIRIFDLPIQKSLKLKVGHIIGPILLFIAGLFSGNQNIIIVYSPPLLLGITAFLLSKIKKTPFIFNVQDIYPQCLVDLGKLNKKTLIAFLEKIEEFIYTKASLIIVHSEGNKDIILKRGADINKIHVVYNWVDTNFIKPMKKVNKFSKNYKLNSKFIVSFAGIFGISQDLDIILYAAQELQNFKEIMFLLIGDGLEKQDLIKKAKNLKLKNVLFLPMQQREEYPNILNASDIGLVTLKKEVVTPVVPSKLINIIASGKSVIASLDLNGDAAKIIKEAKCGYCIEPANPEKLAQVILHLYKNPSLREKLGKNGRKYAEKHFSKDICFEKYENLLLEAFQNFKN